MSSCCAGVPRQSGQSTPGCMSCHPSTLCHSHLLSGAVVGCRMQCAHRCEQSCCPTVLSRICGGMSLPSHGPPGQNHCLVVRELLPKMNPAVTISYSLIAQSNQNS